MNMKPYKNFCLCIDARGVATITLDVPGRPLNVLDKSVMAELDHILRELENTPSLAGVVFQSGKESGFLAGADVNAIAGIESATEAMRVIETGQSLFQRIEWLAVPTLAVIHGPCLGGGLELALACDYRVTRNNSSTKLGLPEIKLGLIPGWGGTQRLPRLVGVRQALSMILTGKHVTASQAKRMQLVDLAIEPEHWESDLAGFIDDVLSGKRTPVSHQRTWKRTLEDSGIGRRLILHMAVHCGPYEVRSTRVRRDLQPNETSSLNYWQPPPVVTCLTCSLLENVLAVSQPGRPLTAGLNSRPRFVVSAWWEPAPWEPGSANLQRCGDMKSPFGRSIPKRSAQGRIGSAHRSITSQLEKTGAENGLTSYGPES